MLDHETDTFTATEPCYLHVQVLQLLMGSCESEEECRNMVAECLGHVALLYPDKALPLLQQQSQVRSQDAHDNPTPKRRRTVRACRASLSPLPLHGHVCSNSAQTHIAHGVIVDVHAATEVRGTRLPCLPQPNAFAQSCACHSDDDTEEDGSQVNPLQRT